MPFGGGGIEPPKYSLTGVFPLHHSPIRRIPHTLYVLEPLNGLGVSVGFTPYSHKQKWVMALQA